MVAKTKSLVQTKTCKNLGKRFEDPTSNTHLVPFKEVMKTHRISSQEELPSKNQVISKQSLISCTHTPSALRTKSVCNGQKLKLHLENSAYH